jgi:hypothetical protein
MADQVVVTESLTEQMVQAGAELLRTLDAQGEVVTAALWIFDESSGAWRFLLASPAVSSAGPKEVYRKVQSTLNSLGNGCHIALGDISVVPTTDSLITLLRSAIRTGAQDVAGIRFSRNAINGRIIEDSFIYRLS